MSSSSTRRSPSATRSSSAAASAGWRTCSAPAARSSSCRTSLGAIGRLCERTLWLDQGRVAFDGPTHETLRRYFDAVGRIDAGRVELETDPHLPVALTSVWITAEDGAPITEPTRHARVVLRLRVQVRERIPGLDVGFYIADSTGLRVLEDTLRVADPASGLGSSPGEAEVAVTLPGVLRADDYLVGVYLYAGDDWLRGRGTTALPRLSGSGGVRRRDASGGAAAAELVRRRDRSLTP